jgi:hypothetical protein
MSLRDKKDLSGVSIIGPFSPQYGNRGKTSGSFYFFPASFH